jgi:hypothetical protein
LSIFLEHSEDGPHTLLNGGLRRIPITSTRNCYRNLLNLCLQHLIEAQLVLGSYCEAVHLGIDVLEEPIVRITNEVHVLGDRWAVHAHVARFSTLFTRYLGIHHFEMIEAWVLKLLHKKINLGGEHVDPFKLVNLAGVGLSALLILAMVRGHLLNQLMSFLNTESQERTSSSSIYMLPG